MMMSYHNYHRQDVITAHREEVIAAQHFVNKAASSAKSIDKICAKLQLHIDPEKQDLVEHIKKEIESDHLRNNGDVDIVDDPEEEDDDNQLEEENGLEIDDKLADDAECASDICTTTDVDMYSSDSPKSSYNPCPSPAMAYLKDSSASPLDNGGETNASGPNYDAPRHHPHDISRHPHDTSRHHHDTSRHPHDTSRHSRDHGSPSSVIVCTHDNTSAMYDMCPVSPVFVSTHDDIHITYDIHPTSPTIDMMSSKKHHHNNTSNYGNNETTSYNMNNISSHRSPSEGSTHNAHDVDMGSENMASTSPREVDADQNYGSSVGPMNNEPSGTGPVCDTSPSPPAVDSSSVANENSGGGGTDKSMATSGGDVKPTKVKPRHTTQYNNWHHNDMIMAIKAVQMKYLSMTAAAKRYGIPRTTLRHYLHDGTNRETKRACFSLAKKHEEDLVTYALDNSHVNEKALYKLIFDKAKEFSQGAILEQGDDGRRVVPTPAWIRRFVYRHKQLHNIFPTFLAKWEHPVMERKIPHHGEKGDDYGTCNGVPHDNNNKLKDKVCTEIIFPKNKYDNYYDRHPSHPPRMYDINGNNNNNNNNNNMVSHNDHGLQTRLDSVSQVNSHLSRTPSDRVDSYHDPGGDHRRNGVKNEKYSDDERIMPYKDLLSRISKAPYTKMTSSHHNSQMLDLNYSPPHRHERKNSEGAPPISTHNLSASDPGDIRNSKYVNLSSIPIIRSNQYTPKTDSTTTSNPDMQHPNEIDDVANKNDVSYSEKLRSLVKPLDEKHVSSNNSITDREPFSEFDVLKITLHAMEESLGVDYVQLFSERYCRNKSLERLYGKWVSLRSELDLTG